MHIYEVRPRKNHRGGDLISDVHEQDAAAGRSPLSFEVLGKHG